jgi:hypothetical protein
MESEPVDCFQSGSGIFYAHDTDTDNSHNTDDANTDDTDESDPNSPDYLSDSPGEHSNQVASVF